MIWYLTIGVIYVMVVMLVQRTLLTEWENEIFKYLGDSKLKCFTSVFALYALYTAIWTAIWPVSFIYNVYSILKRVVR